MSIDRKALIISAATKSFSQFGYKGTSIDQVAKFANVGKGTIYTFFKNKEEMLDYIVSDVLTEMTMVADRFYDPQLPAQQRVHTVVNQLLEFRNTHHLLLKLIEEGRELGTPTVLEMIQKMERKIVDYLSEKILKAMEKGELRTCNPELVSFIILKLYLAVTYEWEKTREPLPKEDIANLFEQYVFLGLSTK